MAAVRERPLNGAAVPHIDFDVYRIPFFLEPNYPMGEEFSESNRERLVRKWGGPAGWEAQKQRHQLKERALEAGIKEKFNLDRHASNTMASHCLVQWVAKTHGLGTSEAVYDDLNRRHFIEGAKLNDRRMLLDLAAAHGCDREAAAAYLDSPEGAEDVRRTYQAVQEMGINGIPTFVIDGGATVLGGAVHAAELERTLRQIEAEVVADPAKAERPGPVFATLLGYGTNAAGKKSARELAFE